ncbi:hypothetical protein ACHAW6_009457 [Cyclotella cf. meneghiniana]
MNPSRRIDELAHRILSAAHWPANGIALVSTEVQSPTPHLDELERALNIRLPPLSIVFSRGDCGSCSGVRTCTLPSGMGKQSANIGASKDEEKIWTWTPAPDNIDNSYSAMQDEVSFEELAPFSPEFYRCLGNLVREAFHPGVVKGLESTNHDVTSRYEPITERSSVFTLLHSLETYSLPRMHDAVRITRILLSLQELRLDDHYTFLDRLLYYCEGNTIPQDCTTDVNVSSTFTDSSSKPKQTGSKIPILSSLFNHWGNLPQLEHGLQHLSRRYSSLLPMSATEYWEYDSIGGTAERNSIQDGGRTGGEWRPSGGESSFLGARAMRIDSFRRRLEEELQCHIHGTCEDDNSRLNTNNPEQGGLVRLQTLIYQTSDATLRGKVRKWMGQRLRSHALGGGSMSYSKGLSDDDSGGMGLQSWGLGPSFLSFCPSIAASAIRSSSGSAGRAFLGGTGPISLTQLGEGGQHNPLGMENTSACGIEALLLVLRHIISGFRPDIPSSTEGQRNAGQRSTILRPSHENLLFDVLIPLHRPSGMVLWRDQTPLIGLYHEALVNCIGEFVNMDASLVGPIICALLHPDIWPTEGGARATSGHAAFSRGAAANTPKVVLLIHEVDTLVGLMRTTNESETERYFSSFDTYVIPLVIKLCSCISSDNSRTSERALQLFKNDVFRRLVKRNLEEAGPHLLRALCRCSGGGSSWEVPWNPTVKKMTYLVLTDLESYYKEIGGYNAFDTACDKSLKGYLNDHRGRISSAETTAEEKGGSQRGPAVLGTRPDDIVATVAMTSVRGAMGSWRPPTQKSKLPTHASQPGVSSNQPPLTVTGVAPWAMGGRNRGAAKLPTASTGTGSNQPPLTITGVAPWAINKKPQLSSLPLPKQPKRPVPGKPLSPQSACGSVEVIIAEDDEEGEVVDTIDENTFTTSRALEKVRAYMDELKPPREHGTSDDGISSWAKAQMEESPVLLPNLKFHDLVFGQELGTGAFSTVKYARQIVKDQTRSNWPEFAVKIVSTQKIEELGYEQSINREIAILRILSHPGISRLISSFRFRDGAYLVLEYASGGDLHTLLRKNGSLDHESTKFVIGSVAAALWSIHELGFVYADCKPENILIMETGHIKITDFGGCRSITEEARALVRASSTNLIQHLRDGDWKATTFLSNKLAQDYVSKQPPEEAEDLRIEGTTAYLPPEVIIGAFPTAAADVWALGCVMFQCISGRPPILEDSDDLTAQKIVSFHVTSQPLDFFGEQEGTSTFRQDEKSLIGSMLNRDCTCRPDILQIANDEYFNDMDIFSLHKKPATRLDIGSVAPSADSKWSRRQFSSIWAPQPHVYNIGASSTTASKGNSNKGGAISEGDEADTFFFSVQKAAILGKIRE